MTTFHKLFIARTLLSLNLKEAAGQTGMTPVSLSALEKGEKKFIPTEYLHFLHEKGIDLNWIFGQSDNTSAVFRIESTELSPDPKHPSEDVPDIAGTLKSILAGNEHVNAKVIIHQHSTGPDTGMMQILEELKKLNEHIGLMQWPSPIDYGN